MFSLTVEVERNQAEFFGYTKIFRCQAADSRLRGAPELFSASKGAACGGVYPMKNQ